MGTSVEKLFDRKMTNEELKIYYFLMYKKEQEEKTKMKLLKKIEKINGVEKNE